VIGSLVCIRVLDIRAAVPEDQDAKKRNRRCDQSSVLHPDIAVIDVGPRELFTAISADRDPVRGFCSFARDLHAPSDSSAARSNLNPHPKFRRKPFNRSDGRRFGDIGQNSTGYEPVRASDSPRRDRESWNLNLSNHEL
jgi:hypothetical protein